MFKEKYKNAYDKIEGDKTQIAKILAAANNSAPAKKKFVFPFKFGTAFAALLVIGISIYSLPKVPDVKEPVENKKTNMSVSQFAADNDDKSYFYSSGEDADDGNKSAEEAIGSDVQTKDVVKEKNTNNTGTSADNSKSLKAEKQKKTSLPSEKPSEDGVSVKEVVPPESAHANEVPQLAAELEETDNAVSGAHEDGENEADTAEVVTDEPHSEAPSVRNAKGGARSANPNIVAQQTLEFPETMGYANVTVYTQNESLEQAFSTQQAISVADKSVIFSGNETDRYAIVKFNDGYAEVYAQNISEQELLNVVTNISL